MLSLRLHRLPQGPAASVVRAMIQSMRVGPTTLAMTRMVVAAMNNPFNEPKLPAAKSVPKDVRTANAVRRSSLTSYPW